MDRVSKENYYLDIAETVSERSTCLRRRFGAIIVKNDVIIATGYNGAPRGRANCSELGDCIRTKLGIQRVNATRPDDLVAILGNYSQAKIAWEGMDAPTAETRAAMEKQVTHLVQAFQTRLATPSNGVVSTVTWNATEPGVVYADTKEPIQ